jgi:futalosine hydrolase
MILVAGATPQELAFLEPRAGITVLVTGVGPVEAAARVTQELARETYSLVVNAGIAGVYHGEAQIGDGVIVAEDHMELDLEVGAPLTLPGGLRVVDKAASTPALVSRLVEQGFHALQGVTVTRATATDATAARLRVRGAQVESMEGFAVLRAAEIGGVRAIELRGISNVAGERSRSGWNFAAGTRGLARIMTALFALEGVAL